MASASPSSNGDDLRVLYCGSIQFPVCVGNIAVPLVTPTGATTSSSTTATDAREREDMSAQVRANAVGRRNPITAVRYTHRRYCYVRDGSDLSEDAFNRWLMQETKSTREDAKKIKKGGKRSRTAAGEGDCPPAVASTSTLYAALSHVEFVVPNSFAQPRRVVREPPFFIVDDTWAEHMVEVHLHFLPALAIPPVVILHQVLLQRRVEAPPALLSAAIGQPKPAPIVVYGTPTAGTNNHAASIHNDGINNEAAAEADLSAAGRLRGRLTLAGLVISERQDAVRILHPSLPLQQYMQRVNDKRHTTVVNELRSFFHAAFLDEHVDGIEGSGRVPRAYQSMTATALSSAEGLLSAAKQHAWQLPYEYGIYAEICERPQRATRALSDTLAALEKEQAELRAVMEQSIKALCEEAGNIKDGLSNLHAACLSLR